MKIHFTLVLLCVGCGACEKARVDPTASSRVKFDASAAAYIHKQGKGHIKGEAFIVTKKGKVIFASGELIRLIPATEYARDRFARLYKGKNFLPASTIPKVTHDPEYVRHTRTTIANGRGKFSFQNVSPGSYFVTAQKVIQNPGTFTPIGGAMFTNVRLGGIQDNTINVILAGK